MLQQRGNQQAPDAAIAIQERGKRLKLQVDQRRLYQRRFGRNPLVRIPVNVTADSGNVTGDSGERDRWVGVARFDFMPRCFFG